MMSVPVVKQPLPTSGGGATGPVGGGPGAGPPTSQTPGKMVPPVPQPGSNTLPKNANPGNQMGVTMGGHAVSQSGGMSQNLPNSNLMKVSQQMPPTASAMPMSMVANHTAAQSMVHQSLSGVGGATTMTPLSLVQEHRAPSSNIPQPMPPAAHAHPTPPPPSSQRAPAPPAHSTPSPTTHPPQSIPPSSSNTLLGGSDKAKELVAGGKPTANGVQVQKVGEPSGGSQQQMRKAPDGPVSLVVNHSAPESMGTTASSIVPSQQSQQPHSLQISGGLQPNPVKPDTAVANHASNQSAKVGLASAPVTNKVSPAPSPVKDKVPPATPPKIAPTTALPKAPTVTASNEAPSPGKSVTVTPAVQATATQGVPIKTPPAPSAPSPAKPATPAITPATAAADTSSSSQAAGATETTSATSASPAKSSVTSASAPEEPKANTTSSTTAKAAIENDTIDAKTHAIPAPEPATPAAVSSTPEKEGKANTPPSATPSRGSKRKRTEIKLSAPTLGSSQAAAIAAASRTPNNKNKSQSDSANIISSKKDDKGDDDEEEERKPKRVRIRTQPYQSPLPEMAYLPKFTRTPTPKAQEDRLILFYKNEFLAVRNAEGSFYVCQTMQNIYKHSARIRIRWLSQEGTASNQDGTKGPSASDGEVYSPDFYDFTDFDCILTNLNLDRLERGKYRLPNVELERTQSILKRALDAEKGLAQKTPLTEEHPDGLDLSLYRDESQLKKRRSSRRKSSQGKGKSSEGKGGEAKQEESKESSSSSSSSSSDVESEEEEIRAKKPKREKRALPPKEVTTPAATPRARSGREAGKRRSGADSEAKTKPASAVAKKRNSSSVRKRRSEAPAAVATPTTPRATPARATRSPKSAPAPSRKERSRVKESRKKPGKKA